MAKEAEFPKHVSFVTDEDQRAEIDLLAEKHKTSQGAVIRELMRRGLLDYYNNGQAWGSQ